MRIGVIIQARMGSNRLPGKVMKSFYKGYTLIEVLLNNLRKISGIKIIVATSTNPENDVLENFLISKGYIVYRGPENDVLERFIGAAETNGIDGVVRICSDNPFLDKHGISELIEKAKNSNADYIGFRVNGKPSILTHFGFWSEYATLSALKKVAATTSPNTPAREHVTYHIYNNSDEYKCEWIECPEFVQGRNDIRLTVDTPEDFDNARRIYSELNAWNEDFSLNDVICYLDFHKDLKESMLDIINKNKK